MEAFAEQIPHDTHLQCFQCGPMLQIALSCSPNLFIDVVLLDLVVMGLVTQLHGEVQVLIEGFSMLLNVSLP